MRKGIFDFDGDGEMDIFERAAEMQFIDEVILAEEQRRKEHDEFLYDENEFLIDQLPSKPQKKKRGEVIGISFMGKPLYDARKDSDGMKILKSLTVTALCIGGMALPIATDMGELGMLLCLAGAVGLSMLILKNN